VTKKKIFQGKLAQPMVPRRIGLLMSEDEGAEQEKEWRDKDVKNLLLLCDHYGIDKNNLLSAFTDLSIALAKELKIPAFTKFKKRGRKEKWDEFTRSVLVADVERTVMPGNDYGVSWAAKELAKKEPWKTFIEEKEGTLGSDPGEVLRQIYYDSVNMKLAAIARKACKYHLEIEKSVQNWECFLKESVGKFSEK
jgi:hypothetical protein